MTDLEPPRPDFTQRRRRSYAEYRCHDCPTTWRFWRPGGVATADRHAQLHHRSDVFHGEIRNIKTRRAADEGWLF